MRQATLHAAVNYAALALSIGLVAAPRALAQAPAIVDTHAHIFLGGPRGADFGGSLDAAVRRMDQYGIQRAVVMPPPFAPGISNAYDIEDYGSAAQAHAGRILPGGGGGSLNAMIHSTAPEAVTDEVKRNFRARAEQIAAAGAVAFGEIALH